MKEFRLVTNILLPISIAFFYILLKHYGQQDSVWLYVIVTLAIILFVFSNLMILQITQSQDAADQQLAHQKDTAKSDKPYSIIQSSINDASIIKRWAKEHEYDILTEEDGESVVLQFVNIKPLMMPLRLKILLLDGTVTIWAFLIAQNNLISLHNFSKFNMRKLKLKKDLLHLEEKINPR